MARRRLLSDELLAPFWAWASDERTIVRHYTLSLADLDLIAKKRTASNRLGFAVLMCGMRFPGPHRRCASQMRPLPNGSLRRSGITHRRRGRSP
jgi:TnpA family transposase